ncbi:hypothetical protein NDU88_011161 [Pleurodeles waltl]|uniref:Uncharacterized protein n=1 Tax=Pleurodeles waltl TaxID=8319 RepID=A0AAV7Q491_PLEWA|nr:hypothetical protein NDU88_011161 [Pleurodeles waltl]
MESIYDLRQRIVVTSNTLRQPVLGTSNPGKHIKAEEEGQGQWDTISLDDTAARCGSRDPNRGLQSAVEASAREMLVTRQTAPIRMVCWRAKVPPLDRSHLPVGGETLAAPELHARGGVRPTHPRARLLWRATLEAYTRSSEAPDDDGEVFLARIDLPSLTDENRATLDGLITKEELTVDQNR